jgi:hypothetical protein
MRRILDCGDMSVASAKGAAFNIKPGTTSQDVWNGSAESAIHGQAQDMDESRFQRLFAGQSNPWGDAPGLK